MLRIRVTTSRDATRNEPNGVIGDKTTFGPVHDGPVSAQHGRYGIEVKLSMDFL